MLESQKKYYQELVSNNPEWELVDIYADEGISGKNIEGRPDVKRLIKDIKDIVKTQKILIISFVILFI